MRVCRVSEGKGRDMRGVAIQFRSCDSLKIEDVVSIEYDNIKRYFKVVKIEAVSKDEILIEAQNYGYYNVLKNIDLRVLFGCEVTKIEDEDLINKLHKESGYC